MMKLSSDYTYLISGAEDGSIFLSKLREVVDGQEINALDMMQLNAKNKEFMGRVANAYSLNPLCLTSKTNNDVLIPNIAIY